MRRANLLLRALPVLALVLTYFVAWSSALAPQSVRLHRTDSPLDFVGVVLRWKARHDRPLAPPEPYVFRRDGGLASVVVIATRTGGDRWRLYRYVEAGWPWRCLEGERYSTWVGEGGSVPRHGNMFPSALLPTRVRPVPFLRVVLVFMAVPILVGMLFRLVRAIGRALAEAQRRERGCSRVAAGRCPECDYELRGCLVRGCPECGWNRVAEVA